MTIGLANPATGAVEALPSGDTFTATSSSPAVGAAIASDSAGAPTLVVNALTAPDPNTPTATVTVNDSAGDVAVELTVNYPVPPVAGDITLDVAGAVVTTQAAPA
jgi:hypothetical protein